jgi:hypothetical protein
MATTSAVIASAWSSHGAVLAVVAAAGGAHSPASLLWDGCDLVPFRSSMRLS